MTDEIEKKSEYQPLTREGLIGYFAQSDLNNDGRVDWHIEMLVTLILNAVNGAEEAARLAERREILEMLKEVREEIWNEDSIPAIDRAINRLEEL